MFGFHTPGTHIQTSAGTLTILDGELMGGGEGTGYQAMLGGRKVFYKEEHQKAEAGMGLAQTVEHRRKRTQWLVSQRFDKLDTRINAPFATTLASGAPGYVCSWIDNMVPMEDWRAQALAYADRVNAVGQLAGLLMILHDRAGIAHGDINASNVVVVGTGANLKVYLIDLGNFNNGNRSMAPLMAGDSEHMAWWLRDTPGVVPDQRSDVYSYGIMAYELLLGRPVTAGCGSVQEMLDRLGAGILPGDPVRGTTNGAHIGLPYAVLPPELQTMLRNMIAPNPELTPHIRDFFRRFHGQVRNLVTCDCNTPYWWHSQRITCPGCGGKIPPALTARLPSGATLPINGNIVLGRAQLGGVAFFSNPHLILQSLRPGAATLTVKGQNGIEWLRRSDGAQLFVPHEHSPVEVVVGDKLGLGGTSIDLV